jgi:hypothetical protein
LIYAIPFGVVSISISQRRENDNDVGPDHQILLPFANFAEPKTAYEAAAAVRKTRYPRQLAARRIRSPGMDVFYCFHRYVLWLVLSPIPLICQMFPRIETRTRVPGP